MPKSEVLYCKGMNMSQSESEEVQSSDGKWDDTELNAAYDKALKLANVEVAKRIAMATNTSSSKKDGKDTSRKNSKKQGNKKQWSSGMPCRAIYEGDGLEYEAFVLKILNDKECIVKFLGYDNSEQVDINTMKPSLGREAQQRQIEQAAVDKGEESDASMPPQTDGEMPSDRGQSPESVARSSTKKASRKKKRNPQPMNGFQFPEVPIPDLNKLRNMASMEIPMPPPIPFLGSGRADCEDQAVSSMLISWYMSGYYTGLYQGLKRSKPNKRQKD